MSNVTYGDKLFGLRDLKVTNIAGTTQEDLGAGMTLEISPEFDGGELKGDDAVVAVVSFMTHAKGKISAGTVSSAAAAIMFGITLTTTGTTPNAVTTTKLSQGQNMPYFKIYGKSLDEGTGDAHLLATKCKVTGGGTFKFENGNFWTSELEIICVDDGTNGIFRLLQNETATNLPTS